LFLSAFRMEKLNLIKTCLGNQGLGELLKGTTFLNNLLKL